MDPPASASGPVEVRRCRPEDWPALRAIRLEALKESPDAYGSTYHEVAAYPDERWRTMAAEGYFLAERDAKVVGMASGGTNDRYPGTYWLYGMYVTPNERGADAAALLVAAVVERALALGAEQLYLQVTTALERASRFYAKMGFVDVGERQAMHRDARLVLMTMRKDLGEPLLVVRRVEAAELYGLRRRILRGDDPTKDVANPRDGDATTWHFGGFVGSRLVAGASFFRAPSPVRADLVSYQLRYLAVESDVQGRGYGSLVLSVAERRLRASGVEQLWAHARDSALGFYLATGWEAIPGSEHSSAETGLAHTSIARVLI